jgi:hypothetical protein
MVSKLNIEMLVFENRVDRDECPLLCLVTL